MGLARLRLPALAALAACHAPAPPPRAAPAPTTAPEILARLADTYAHAATYSDHGVTRTGHTVRSFETQFVRNARFRFDLRDENDPQRGLVLWADGTHTYTRLYAPPHTSDDGPGLTLGIAVATEPSLGVARTLAALLEPAQLTMSPLGSLRLAGTEPVDDRPCFVVTGTRGDSEIALWIDRETFVLRRAREDSREASFAPVLGGRLAAADIAPPDFSDDYADDSPEVVAARALVARPAPPFDAVLLGKAGRTSLASLAGKVVVVDFWATWCGPCQRTMPRLEAWHERFGARGLAIVGLSSEDEPDIAPVVAERHLGYTIARDEKAVAARAYHVTALPTLVVVDRTGVVRYVTLGAGNLDAAEAVIESLLR